MQTMLIRLNEGMNAPRFIETFKDNKIPKEVMDYLKVLKKSGKLSHIRIPGGTVSQDYFPTTGGGNWVFSHGKPLSEYIPYLKELEVPVIWVANMLYPNQINELTYAIDLLLKNKIKVIGIELGNENFAHKDRHGIDYLFNLIDITDRKKLDNMLSDFKTHIHVIRQLYPDIKISVPVAKSGNKTLQRWNDEMLKLGTEAVSYHCYIDFGKEANQLKTFGGNIKRFSDTGKEVWVTEYNMQFNDPKTNWNNYLSKKHLDMIHITMPKMFQDNGAKLISRHSLFGNGQVSPFFAHISVNENTNEFKISDKIV